MMGFIDVTARRGIQTNFPGNLLFLPKKSLIFLQVTIYICYFFLNREYNRISHIYFQEVFFLFIINVFHLLLSESNIHLWYNDSAMQQTLFLEMLPFPDGILYQI